MKEEYVNKLFCPNGLPWTKVTGIGKNSEANTLFNIQDHVDGLIQKDTQRQEDTQK